ncbi:sap61 [Candida theae]|uniref:Sap61 n=1 Tax=Candida theae TaxID=1198502 RepID=A0AAD5BET7_9ASCO|nr:sap61 [Candida theae]KAI5957781.1 sap61 [Candida theae]
MSSTLESQRLALENLDAIEDALTQRFLRNPNLLPKSLRRKYDNIPPLGKNRAYTKRLFRLQQHELRHLSQEYDSKLKQVLSSVQNDAAAIHQELQSIEEDGTFEKFEQLIAPLLKDTNEGPVVRGVQQQYALFGSADPKTVKVKLKKRKGQEVVMAKRSDLLSNAASHIQNIELDDVLDLKQFHQFYNENFTSSEIPYVQYLYSFNKFPYEKSNKEVYRSYLKSLYNYLKQKYIVLYPLSDIVTILKEVESTVENKASQNQNGLGSELYCAVCDKHFATTTVYKAHLESKKHLKKVKKVGETFQNEENKPNAWYERSIQILATHLDEAIHQTEKYLVSSERARFNEEQDQIDIENEYTEIENSGDSDSNGESSSDSENDDDLFKNLPLGSDGTPIPYWLYKLQGLHKTYRCEICGNVGYKGKQAFERHFNSAKHQKGLQLLGIAEDQYQLFKNISSIDEAQNLMDRLKKEARLKQSELHDAIEVEDKQGNVMSYIDYLDLKKQGLK